MRNEFYGDRKDVWKWTVATRAAGERKPICYVPMLTRNDGNLFTAVKNAAPAVATFFDSERKLFESSARDVKRIENLLRGRISILGGEFRHARRQEYFQGVAARLKHLDEPVVLLVDPDNGLACTKSGKQHIEDGELRLLWDCLKPCSTLLLFQVSGGRRKDWLGDRLRAFTEALSVPTSTVQPNHNAGIFILEATK